MNDYQNLELNINSLSTVYQSSWQKSLLNMLNEIEIKQNYRNSSVKWEFSKIGSHQIPIIQFEEKQFILNSRYEPAKEAAKTVSSLDNSEMIIIIGFEAGYIIEALCNTQDRFKRIACIDGTPQMVLEAMKKRNLTALFSDHRFSLHCIDDRDAIPALIAQIYQTQFFRSIQVYISVPIRSWYHFLGVDLESTILNTIHKMQTDFITQSRFGKRWLYNIISNLRVLNNSPSINLGRLSDVIIIGAGPSLECNIDQIKTLQAKGIPVFVCDAAFDWCIQQDIKVDLVLSIDGQSISYTHLLQTRHGKIIQKPIFIADLCSHPSYAREENSNLFLMSGHPFLQYLYGHGLVGDSLNTGGGNVGQSLLHIVLDCGATTIHVFGMDFAYIQGKPYARPAFIYSDFLKNSNRLASFEQGIIGLWINETLEVNQDVSGIYKTTDRLKIYAQSFSDSVASTASNVVSYSPTWNTQAPASTTKQFSAKIGLSGVHLQKGLTISKIINTYQIELKDLISQSIDPATLYFGKKTETRNLVLSILPLMAWYMAVILKKEPECSDISKRAFTLAAEHTAALLSQHFPHGGST